MVRLLLYSDDIDIEAIVCTRSWRGPFDKRVGGVFPASVHAAIDQYERVYNNLRLHSNRYMDPDSLHSKVKSGYNAPVDPDSFMSGDYMRYVGSQYDSEASRYIINVVDKDDDRPVWFLGWGKMLDLAQALWRVRCGRLLATRAWC